MHKKAHSFNLLKYFKWLKKILHSIIEKISLLKIVGSFAHAKKGENRLNSLPGSRWKIELLWIRKN